MTLPSGLQAPDEKSVISVISPYFSMFRLLEEKDESRLLSSQLYGWAGCTLKPQWLCVEGGSGDRTFPGPGVRKQGRAVRCACCMSTDRADPAGCLNRCSLCAGPAGRSLVPMHLWGSFFTAAMEREEAEEQEPGLSPPGCRFWAARLQHHLPSLSGPNLPHLDNKGLGTGSRIALLPVN